MLEPNSGCEIFIFFLQKHCNYCTALLQDLENYNNLFTTDDLVNFETERTPHDYADSSGEMDEESRSQEGTTNFEEYVPKKKRTKDTRPDEAFTVMGTASDAIASKQEKDCYSALGEYVAAEIPERNAWCTMSGLNVSIPVHC